MLPLSLLLRALPFTLLTKSNAQTYTDCNPLIAKCDANPALGTRYDWDFSSQGASSDFHVISAAGAVNYDDNGVSFVIEKSGDAPTIASNFYIMFGHVEIVAKSAPGVGIVSAAVLISNDLDEIDWEWLGKDINEVQTNYFSKGDDAVFNRGGFSQVADAQNDFHTYAIDWTASSTTWYIDGQVVRVLNNPGSGYYPQTPMQVKIGSWSAGDPSNRIGTIEWAGGETDYSKGPYSFVVKSISVQDYSTGSAYSYSDHSGSWTSIQSTDGEVKAQGADTASDVSAQQANQQQEQPSPQSSSTSSTPTPVVSPTPTPSPSLSFSLSPPQVVTTVFVEASPSPSPSPSADSNAEVAVANAQQPAYDDGQYHPDPKFDDGTYRPQQYADGFYKVKKSYVGANSSASTTVEQSNMATGFEMSRGLVAAALALSLTFLAI